MGGGMGEGGPHLTLYYLPYLGEDGWGVGGGGGGGGTPNFVLLAISCYDCEGQHLNQFSPHAAILLLFLSCLTVNWLALCWVEG